MIRKGWVTVHHDSASVADTSANALCFLRRDVMFRICGRDVIFAGKRRCTLVGKSG